MKIEQHLWTRAHDWRTTRTDDPFADAGSYQLLLAFGDIASLADPERFAELRAMYPAAHIASCSTAGEILDTTLYGGTITATAIAFDAVTCRVAALDISACADSREAGERLALAISHDGLVHVLVISDGQRVNGSDLVLGLHAALAPGVTITGGLAGDGSRFERTVAGLDEPPSEGKVVVIGFYGDALRVGFGSGGGGEAFGHDRVITRSKGNVLYELDGGSALDLYKRYLGDRAGELPASALFFPLSVSADESATPVVRTILSIDEATQSMTFAGTMPQGATARLMRANPDRLIDGASRAACASRERVAGVSAELAIVISCVGRSLVLGPRTEEEIEEVRNVLGPRPAITGFYSYGEISSDPDAAACDLHNQTMSVTTFSEG